MLAYAGLLASPTVQQMSLACFDLENVSVIGWETRRIPESQQNKLGIISQLRTKIRPRMLLVKILVLDLTYMIATENAL